MGKIIRLMSVFALVAIAACGSGSGDIGDISMQEVVNTTKKVLASNVIIGEAEAAEGVDTTTKVLARNVVIQPKLETIASENVQDAFAEIKPGLATLLTSTPWKAYGYANSCLKDVPPAYETGITFNSDGTIEVSGDENRVFYYLNNYQPISYEVIGNSALYIEAKYSTGYKFYTVVSVLEMTPNKIVLLGANNDVAVLEPHDGSEIEGTGEPWCSAGYAGYNGGGTGVEDSDGSS